MVLTSISSPSGSGQQLRQDDPSALKQIIDLVKQKQQGVDPTKIKSVADPALQFRMH